jgi:hypothetical protein
VRLSKNGGNMAQKNESTSCTHDEIGWYDCPLDSTDTNTLGILHVMVAESGALPVWARFVVLAANIYDSLISDSDELQVHANEITAGLITATAIADNAITAAKIATDAITAAKIADGAIDAATFAAGAITATVIATNAIDADALAADAIAEINATVDTAISDAALATAAALATVDDFLDTEIAAILADTNELQTDWVNGGRLDLLIDAILDDTGTSGVVLANDAITAAKIAANAIGSSEIADGAITAAKIATDAIDADALAADAIAEINATVDTALTDIHLDHLLAADYDPANKPGTATALLNELVENDGGVSRFTENALEQGPGGAGSDPWETEVPGAYDPGTAGFILGTNLDVAVSSVEGAAGAGAIEFTYTVTEQGSGDPIADVDVWVTSDSAGTNTIASGRTDASGEVVFMLDAATVYIWRQKQGWNFTNPDEEEVS